MTSETFRRRLKRLKAGGSNILVLAPNGGHEPICRRLTGQSDHSQKLCVVTETSHSECSVADARARPVYHGIVDVGPDFLTTEDTTPEPSVSSYERVDSPDALTALGQTIEEQLNRLKQHDPAPGQLRVCVRSLDALIDAVDPQRLYRFLHVLSRRILHASAVAHFHVTRPVDEVTRNLLESLFDATLCVARDDGAWQQRWQLHDTGLDTDWFDLSVIDE